MTLRRLLASALLLVCLPLSAATEIIQLDYRMAADVLPIAQSVVGDQGRVNAYGNQLIVNAPAAVIDELRGVLGQLDSEPMRLLISVDTSNSSSGQERGYRVDGSASVGNVQIETGRGEVRGRDQVRIIRRSTQELGSGVQQVQATEGYPALIQIGQSVPLTTSGTDSYGQPYRQTQYQNVMRGFYATATVTGDRVHVAISSNNDRVERIRPEVISVQSTDTRVSGRLGEWIPLGSVAENSTGSQSGLTRRHTTQGQQDLSLRIKVDRLD